MFAIIKMKLFCSLGDTIKRKQRQVRLGENIFNHISDEPRVCKIYKILFFLTSLLEYNCFTMVCQFLLYNKVNQLYIYIYPHIPLPLASPSHPPYLTPLGGHKAPRSSPCAMWLVPPSYLFYIWQCIYVHANLSLRPSLPFPLPVSSSPFSTSVSLFLSYPYIFQNFFFFLDSIYMCQHTVFVFLFLTYFTLYDRLQVHPPQ